MTARIANIVNKTYATLSDAIADAVDGDWVIWEERGDSVGEYDISRLWEYCNEIRDDMARLKERVIELERVHRGVSCATQLDKSIFWVLGDRTRKYSLAEMNFDISGDSIFNQKVIKVREELAGALVYETEFDCGDIKLMYDKAVEWGIIESGAEKDG